MRTRTKRTPGNRIAELRKARGLTLAEVAERMGDGTTEATVGRLQNGGMQLTLDWMRRLAAALECKPADLLADEDVAYRLDDDERELIQLYEDMPDPERRRFLALAAAFGATMPGPKARS